ncbi:hypothetical protein RCL1_000218 [Eukaryota sp. TZLM3-RCL]
MTPPSKLTTIDQVLPLIRDDSTLACSGFCTASVANYFCSSFAKYFAANQSPKNLTLVYAAGQGDGQTEGLNHFAIPKAVKRVVGGHYNLAPKLGKMALANEIEAYNFPQGVISSGYRSLARNEPFVISRIGLHTFVDPRLEGGKVTPECSEDLVSLMEIDGVEYLKYKLPKLDVVVIRGSIADHEGNISMQDEGVNADVLVIAQACKANNGIVIAEVNSVVPHLSRDAKILPINVHVPGVFVDHVLEIPEEFQCQTFKTKFNPDFIGVDCWEENGETSSAPVPPLLRSIVGSRSAMEFLHLKPNPVCNIGIGMPEDCAFWCNKNSISLVNTVEVGGLEGIPASGLNFGCMYKPRAIIPQNSMFDSYHSGTFLDVAVLGLAEVDQLGNLNVSKFGTRLAGSGGFIDIAQSCPTILFVGTFNAGKLEVDIKDGKLVIVKEGTMKKFVKKVQQVTFSAYFATLKKQVVKYITERATFELINGVLTLMSIAPGVDLQRDVLDHMDFIPAIADCESLVDADYFKFLKMDFFQ